MTADEVIKDIKEHPEKHKHDFEQLKACCFINGCMDLSVMEAHSIYGDLGRNGGVRCDVTQGPCACGGWH